MQIVSEDRQKSSQDQKRTMIRGRSIFRSVLAQCAIGVYRRLRG